MLRKSRNVQFERFEMSALSSGNHGCHWNEQDSATVTHAYMWFRSRDDADDHEAPINFFYCSYSPNECARDEIYFSRIILLHRIFFQFKIVIFTQCGDS